MPKLDKDKTKTYRSISLMNINAKISVTYLQTKLNTLKRSYTMIKLVSFLECKDGSHSYNHLTFPLRCQKMYIGEKIYSSTNGVGKTE
jgi:hypothetical protein